MSSFTDSTTGSLADFPTDVLALILFHLEPQDYLAFARVTKAIHSEYRQEPAYWRTQTAHKFRLPISPLLAADGPRWYWLYKRLKTQTRLYTWGQGLRGNLGLGRSLSVPRRRLGILPPTLAPDADSIISQRPLEDTDTGFTTNSGGIPLRIDRPFQRQLPRTTFTRASSNWPTETHIPDEIGVIADLQCGGWSTTILSSEGRLYTVGSLDSLNGISIGGTAEQFHELQHNDQDEFPIHSFSAGRRHVLALTDGGHILSWDRIDSLGSKIYSRQSSDFGGRPTRVAAGWGMSSAYIPETGIVYWEMVRSEIPNERFATRAPHDESVHVQEKIIPGTARRVEEQPVIEVPKHIVLEDFIVWITSNSKLYAHDLRNERSFPIPGYARDGRELKDVQGQYQKFGVFTGDGEVLAGSTAYLDECSQAIQRDPHVLETDDWVILSDLLAARPEDVPALQHSGVIALAYGDHHYHALHADGKITSYGTDSQSCGSLGLGALPAGARFRGLVETNNGHFNRDAKLLPIAELRGRAVWFEPEKREWLASLETDSRSPAFGLGVDDGPAAHFPREGNAEQQTMLSEWMEQESRHWEDGPSSAREDRAAQPSNDQADDANITPATSSHADTYNHLLAYFGITIAAAGWHSGALVLVDDVKAEEVRQKWIYDPSTSVNAETSSSTGHEMNSDKVQEQEQPQPDPIMMPGRFIPPLATSLQEQNTNEEDDKYIWSVEGFPKVVLPDGTYVPGKGNIRPWREGMPTLQTLGLQSN